MRQVHTIKPIYDENSKILILGSFPSVASRNAMMYYSHPQNRFWEVMSVLFDEEIYDKFDFLIKHNIALWDVVKSCQITGSSDASIKNIEVNDISLILRNADIRKIFVNGNKAYQLYNKYILPVVNIEAVLLPSTSSANASKGLDALVKDFSVILDFLYSRPS